MELFEETPEKKPVNARALALRRLGVREYSAYEMKSYLRRKGVSDDEAQRVVTELQEENLIDDRRYATAVAREQSLRDKGPGRILAKLKSKGVNTDMSEARALFAANSDRDELELARSLVRRRYPRVLEDLRESRRAYSSLIRRGFSGSIAREAVTTPDLAQNES